MFHRKHLKALVILTIILFLLSTSAQAIKYTDYKIINNTQEAKISEQGKYIGAIKLSELTPRKINSILIRTDTYELNLTFIEEKILIIFPTTRVYSNFTDYKTGLNFTTTFTTDYFRESAFLEVPETSKSLNSDELKITRDNLIWHSSGGVLASKTFLIPNLLMNVSISTNAIIKITGIGTGTITYYIGSESEMEKASTTTLGDQGNDWFKFIITNIPFIGNFLYDSIAFLTAFFNFSLMLFAYLLTDPVLIYMLFLIFSLMKGIFVITVGGGNVIDMIVSIIKDHIGFFKLVIYFVVSVTGLMWRIVLAISNLIKAIRPI